MIASIVPIHAIGASCRVTILLDELPSFTGRWDRTTVGSCIIFPQFLLMFISRSCINLCQHSIAVRYLLVICSLVYLLLCCCSLLGIANADRVAGDCY